MRGGLDVPRTDPLAERVVAGVPEYRHRIQRRRPVHEGVPEPMRDDTDLPVFALLARSVAGGDWHPPKVETPVASA